jgi:hypothetical protein
VRVSDGEPAGGATAVVTGERVAKQRCGGFGYGMATPREGGRRGLDTRLRSEALQGPLLEFFRA